MRTVVIKIQKRWNGVIEGAYVNGQWIWDHQVEGVVRDYKNRGVKVIIKEVRKR